MRIAIYSYLSNTIAGGMQTLSKELDAATSDVYKRDVALGLFYKVSCHTASDLHLSTGFFQFYLSCIKGHCSPANVSAASELLRPVSSGIQSFSTDTSESPAGQPLDKLGAKLQVINNWSTTVVDRNVMQ